MSCRVRARKSFLGPAQTPGVMALPSLDFNAGTFAPERYLWGLALQGVFLYPCHVHAARREGDVIANK